jgi:hypothetical protein
MPIGNSDIRPSRLTGVLRIGGVILRDRHVHAPKHAGLDEPSRRSFGMAHVLSADDSLGSRNKSSQFGWTGVPADTKSFAVVVGVNLYFNTIEKVTLMGVFKRQRGRAL